jgi:hypothetical protein
MRLLAISGSLRRDSYNRMLFEAAARLKVGLRRAGLPMTDQPVAVPRDRFIPTWDESPPAPRRDARGNRAGGAGRRETSRSWRLKIVPHLDPRPDRL